MKLTNASEYTVDVFGRLYPPGFGVDGEECAAVLRVHPEIVNSLGKNGLSCDAEALQFLGVPVASPTVDAEAEAKAQAEAAEKAAAEAAEAEAKVKAEAEAKAQAEAAEKKPSNKNR